MPYKDKADYKRWQETNKSRKALLSRKSWLKKAYGLTPEQYEELEVLHEGKCAICETAPSTKRKSLDIDHCHQLGHVRGLLCSKCNKLLGMANDKVSILKAAIMYLESYQESLEDLNKCL